MDSLRTLRVNILCPFSHCDIDYAGPVTVRDDKCHNSRTHKTYVADF